MFVAVGRRRRDLFDESDACCGLILESVAGDLRTNSLHHPAKLLKCRVAICMETWTAS